MNDLQQLLDACKRVKSNRNIGSIHRSISSEVGELAEEVDIVLGTSYKQPSDDGVVGEAIDVILGCLDIISVHDPKFDSQQLFNYAMKKIGKWEDKVNEHKRSENAPWQFESDEDQLFHIKKFFDYGKKINAARMYMVVDRAAINESTVPRWYFTADECYYSMPGDDFIRLEKQLAGGGHIIINHDYKIHYESIEDRTERILKTFNVRSVGYKEGKRSDGFRSVKVNPHFNDLMNLGDIDPLCSALEREFFSTVAYVGGNNSLQFHTFDLTEKK